jgi:poly(A) polymerase
MIKSLINKILARGPARAKASSQTSAPTGDEAPAKAPRSRAKKAKSKAPTGERVELNAADCGIDVRLVDERAYKVVSTLKDAGYEAYIVGGAVRDLLLGLRPKDFDVATNATPEQVKGLFRRAFIIGKRFRIVHVVYGRGREHEVIEVSTFRAYLDAGAAEQVSGNEKTSRKELGDKSHVVDASGRVLRDNVWGPQDQDAARRDFTINAMYYDPIAGVVVDYHGGIDDARARVLRMIGEPDMRYREDPVRIIRVVRFAAKLGFEIEPGTRAPLRDMASLLSNVPQSRLFDEMIKLLQTGHARASLEELRKQGLDHGLFPILDAVFDPQHPPSEERLEFIDLALADTDRRVGEGKPVAPSFLLACLLWHDVRDEWDTNLRNGVPSFPALQQATDAVFNARIGDISGRGKLAADMREIWTMQPRFDRRVGNGPYSLVQQPRFRAGFDFLRLRGQVGEVEPELADWWEDFSLADDETRDDLVAQAREAESQRRQSRAPLARGAAASTTGTDGGLAGEAGDVGEGDAPAKKRRRRRRKPAGEGRRGGAASGGPGE